MPFSKIPTTAREIFFNCVGNAYFMHLNGVYDIYAAFQVPEETEMVWRREMLTGILDQLPAETNCEKLSRAVQNYCTILGDCHFAGTLPQILQCVLAAAPKTDTFTMLRVTEDIFAYLEKMPYCEEFCTCCDLARRLVTALEDNAREGISLSPDYVHGEPIPEHLQAQQIQKRWKKDRKRWRMVLLRQKGALWWRLLQFRA